jgi:DNA polymerase-3 subunit epsilon
MAKELGSIIDVETTGVDSTKDKITEIGVLQFEYDPEQFKDSPGAPELTITGMYAGLQDPGRPLTAEIVKLTGLTDKVLAGKKIDWASVRAMLESSSLVLAHNAAFDRAFVLASDVEKEFEGAVLGRWACTMQLIDWEAHGYKTRSLNYLAADHGFVNPFPHRAVFDCATTYKLMAPHFEELYRNKDFFMFRVEATDAPFRLKDTLKARRYIWDSEARVWFKEMLGPKLVAERVWLASEIYGGKAAHREVIIKA